MQIVDGNVPSWQQKQTTNPYKNESGDDEEELDWIALEADIYHWTKPLRPVQVQTRCEHV